MTPVTIPLEAAVRGDKWQGIASIGPVTINGAAPAAALTRIRMQFRSSVGRLGMTLDSEAGEGAYPITITNAATWLAHIAEVQPLPLGVGSWSWDMEFYSGSDTAPQTLYQGTLRVLSDQTKP